MDIKHCDFHNLHFDVKNGCPHCRADPKGTLERIFARRWGRKYNEPRLFVDDVNGTVTQKQLEHCMKELAKHAAKI